MVLVFRIVLSRWKWRSWIHQKFAWHTSILRILSFLQLVFSDFSLWSALSIEASLVSYQKKKFWTSWVFGPMSFRTYGFSARRAFGPTGFLPNGFSAQRAFGPTGLLPNGFSAQWAVIISNSEILTTESSDSVSSSQISIRILSKLPYYEHTDTPSGSETNFRSHCCTHSDIRAENSNRDPCSGQLRFTFASSYPSRL